LSITSPLPQQTFRHSSRDSQSTYPDLQLGLGNPIRKRKRNSGINEGLGTEDADTLDDEEERDFHEATALSDYDGDVRWLSFRFHSNRFYDATIRKHFGAEICDTSRIFEKAKQKMIDNIKSHKSQMIKAFFRHMEIQKKADTDLWTLSDDDFRQSESLSFLFSLHSPSSLHYSNERYRVVPRP